MSSRKKMRDFQRCLRSIQSVSDNQAKISEWDDAQLDWVELVIRPNSGLYKGGSFTFKVFMEKEYPKNAPRVDCLTPIYHPNIDPTCEDYNVCLSLFDEWDEKFGLEDVIQGLLFLLYNPNIEDPLSPYFDGEMEEDVFAENVKQSLEGGSLDEETEIFPENMDMEKFCEDDLHKGIELILERACQMVISGQDEEEEEGEARNDENADQNTDRNTEEIENNNNNENSEDTGATAADGQVIMRVDSKIERSDTPGAVSDAACDKAEGGSWSDVDNPASVTRWAGLARYIPKTFIPTEPDFLVSAFMACVNLAAR